MSSDITTLFQQYIRECQYSRRLRPETLRGYREVIRLFQQIMPEVTETKYLTEDMLIEFFKRAEVRPRTVGINTTKIGIKNSTIRTYWSKLNSFFTWLHTKGHIAQNPLKFLTPPSVEYTDSRALTEEQIQKIIAAIALNPINNLALRRDMAMIHTLAFCGLRKNEFLNLKLADIDFEKRELTVHGASSKSKFTRIIPMHPTLEYHLKEYFAERRKEKITVPYAWIRLNRDSPLTTHGLKHWVKRLVKLSKVKFHLHQLRHFFACALAMKDVNLLKIQKLLGHKDIKMTMTYVRSLQPETFRIDIEKLNI